jgi:hypothetical protein
VEPDELAQKTTFSEPLRECFQNELTFSRYAQAWGRKACLLKGTGHNPTRVIARAAFLSMIDESCGAEIPIVNRQTRQQIRMK